MRTFVTTAVMCTLKITANGGNKARLACTNLSKCTELFRQMGFIECYRLFFINRILTYKI